MSIKTKQLLEINSGILSLAVATVLATAAAPSAAQNYWVLKSIPAQKAGVSTPGPTAPTISLAAGILPEGMDGTPYSFDLKTLTQVTGGTGIAAAQFAVGGGTLPTGISLSNEGLLAGTPTAQTAPEGSSFTVTGTYLTATGQQAYTIKVGESVLHVVQIATSKFQQSFTCAITTAGAAKCWGVNSMGQLGNGTNSSASVPVQVSGLNAGVSSISVGRVHVCAIVSGAVRCWGGNNIGQLGNGTTTASNVPVQVDGLESGASSATAGHSHSCAIVSGDLKCWGSNGVGQLGDGTTNNSSVPIQVAGLTTGVTQVSAWNITCAVVSGAAKCWGSNSGGNLGDGTTNDSLVPVQVFGLTSAVSSISVGDFHTCAVVSGAAKCWGRNSAGFLVS